MTDVSVIVPVYNAGGFLLEALDSIDRNRAAGIKVETIIVDDCSTDPRTLALLEGQRLRSDTRLLRSRVNGGAAAARNHGLAIAKGEWITFLDADDLMCDGSLASRLATLKMFPHIDWAASNVLEMSKPGVVTEHRAHQEIVSGQSMSVSGVWHIPKPTSLLIRGYPIFLASMLIRRSLFEKVGGLDSNLRFAEDWYYSLLLSLHADLFWIDESSFVVRRYHQSTTSDVVRAALENYKAELSAFRNPALALYRRELRWRLSGVMRFSADRLLEQGRSSEALRLAIGAAFFGRNDSRAFRSVARALFGCLKIT